MTMYKEYVDQFIIWPQSDKETIDAKIIKIKAMSRSVKLPRTLFGITQIQNELIINFNM